MQGFTQKQIQTQRYLNLRYDGTDVPIMTPCPPTGDYSEAFRVAYQVPVAMDYNFAVHTLCRSTSSGASLPWC